jgi:two-component system nitrate/nitrite response regulator NarL
MLDIDAMQTHSSNKNLIIFSRNRLFREGLKYILNCNKNRVIGECGSFTELNTDLKNIGNRVSLIVCETTGDFCDEYETLAGIIREFPSISVVILTDRVSQRDFELAMKCGAKGFLPKDISAEALEMSLALILLGEDIFTTPASLKVSLSSPQPLAASKDLRAPLSQKETVILKCLETGLSNKGIARELGMAEATVKVHIKAILRKINVENRTQAAVWSMSNPRLQSESAII